MIGRHLVTLAGVAWLVGCSDAAVVAPPLPSVTECDGVSTAVRTLAPMEGVVLAGAEANCFALAGGDREYLVMPQLTGATLPYGAYGFRLGDPAASNAVTASAGTDPVPTLDARGARALLQPSPPDSLLDAQSRLDHRLRQHEATHRATPAGADLGFRSHAQQATAPEAIKQFSVLSTLAETEAWTPVGAELRYAGTKVLIYVDTLARDAFTEGELTAMGMLYDVHLVPAATAAFGSGSDIDGNARVMFVLTPTVNALVTSSQCATSGFVRGFFFSHDLSSKAATSNRGEVFFAYVPDEAGRWSCTHSKAEVLANVPPTFIHELQHMISYGEHAVKRGGATEEPWLNEGLSHVAEELGSLTYETRFPAPAGRSNPASIFPDSAAPFINPDVLYSYRYLFSSATYSITSCAPGSFCTLAERGGTWLFLRWLADTQGADVLRRLVETRLTGRANLEAAAARSTGALLGSFAMSVSNDSIVGAPRAAMSGGLRFGSRNLRRLYRNLFDAFGIAGGVSRPFPIEPLTLAPGTGITGTMRPGTFLTYRLRIPAQTPSAILRMSAQGGSPFTPESGAQVAVLRLP